jgi:hypothetical protein
MEEKSVLQKYPPSSSYEKDELININDDNHFIEPRNRINKRHHQRGQGKRIQRKASTSSSEDSDTVTTDRGLYKKVTIGWKSSEVNVTSLSDDETAGICPNAVMGAEGSPRAAGSITPRPRTVGVSSANPTPTVTVDKGRGGLTLVCAGSAVARNRTPLGARVPNNGGFVTPSPHQNFDSPQCGVGIPLDISTSFNGTPSTGKKVNINPARESGAIHSLLSTYLESSFEEEPLEEIENMSKG